MNVTIPDSIHSLRFIRIFNNAATFESLITSVGVRKFLIGHHLTFEDSLPVELVLIFLAMPCDYVHSQMLPSVSAKDIQSLHGI